MGVAAVTTAMALFGTTRYTPQGQDAGKPIPVKAMAKEADPDWEVDPNGWMDGPAEWGTSSRHVEALKNASMADLALILQFHVDRPVVDQTGLKGRYDFKLQWTLDDAQTAAPDAPPELFTAIQEQIGLKMERVNVLVIDKVEKPGAN
jgi:uncharacterized protein (TIGR03435 family)